VLGRSSDDAIVIGGRAQRLVPGLLRKGSHSKPLWNEAR
jgi:hypothetical protein